MLSEIKKRIKEKLLQNTIFSRETQVIRIEKIRKLLLELSNNGILSDEEMLNAWDSVIIFMGEYDLMNLYYETYIENK